MFTLDGVRKFHSWTHASLTLLLDHLSIIPLGLQIQHPSQLKRGSIMLMATRLNILLSPLPEFFSTKLRHGRRSTCRT